MFSRSDRSPDLSDLENEGFNFRDLMVTVGIDPRNAKHKWNALGNARVHQVWWRSSLSDQLQVISMLPKWDCYVSQETNAPSCKRQSTKVGIDLQKKRQLMKNELRSINMIEFSL